jgi:hypothetical protein
VARSARHAQSLRSTRQADRSGALGPSGTTVANEPINPETQYADLRHEPDPARQAERDRLGLLGRLAAFFRLIEVYSQTPDAEEFRACLSKHLGSWQQRARKTRSDHKKRSEQQPAEAFVDSFLWIIAAGAPTTLLAKLKLESAPHWPAGVYFFGDDVLRVGIIVASELPATARRSLSASWRRGRRWRRPSRKSPHFRRPRMSVPSPSRSC